jgi:hypothetical protein
MPLLDLHNLLLNAAVQHLNCPLCGADMETVQTPVRKSWWRRALLLPPRVQRHYHCGTCGGHYGLVKLQEDKHEPS